MKKKKKKSDEEILQLVVGVNKYIQDNLGDSVEWLGDYFNVLGASFTMLTFSLVATMPDETPELAMSDFLDEVKIYILSQAESIRKMGLPEDMREAVKKGGATC